MNLGIEKCPKTAGMPGHDSKKHWLQLADISEKKNVGTKICLHLPHPLVTRSSSSLKRWAWLVIQQQGENSLHVTHTHYYYFHKLHNLALAYLIVSGAQILGKLGPGSVSKVTHS